jgi:hypothetical protein
MRKFLLFSLVLAVTLTLGLGMALAGNDAPAGPHYNLNIIGVERGKTVPMTGSHRHTIFVALGKNTAVKTKIYLTEGPFEVCDGNGFDLAYNCLGDVIGQNGAAFQLPPNGCEETDCDQQLARTYLVYVRALGTPGGSGKITTCVETATEEICSSGETVQLPKMVNGKRTSKFVERTKELTTIVIDGVRYGLFENAFWQYFWEYDNNGLKLVQLRFYNLADINRPGE